LDEDSGDPASNQKVRQDDATGDENLNRLGERVLGGEGTVSVI